MREERDNEVREGEMDKDERERVPKTGCAWDRKGNREVRQGKREAETENYRGRQRQGEKKDREDGKQEVVGFDRQGEMGELADKDRVVGGARDREVDREWCVCGRRDGKGGRTALTQPVTRPDRQPPSQSVSGCEEEQ